MASASTAVRAQPMIPRAIWIRICLAGCLLLIFGHSPKVVARTSDSSSLATPNSKWSPKCSLGIQVGNYNATGFSGQYFGVLGGAIDVAVAIGLGKADLGIAADYVRYLGFGLKPIAIGDYESYNNVRDRILPFVGAGLQIDDGLGIRLPMGVQYALPKHPMTLWGGVAIYVGPFMSSRVFGAELWFSLGARLLI